MLKTADSTSLVSTIQVWRRQFLETSRHARSWHRPQEPHMDQMVRCLHHYIALLLVSWDTRTSRFYLTVSVVCVCGPGMNKMVINHLEKLFVTNDAATILKELEVRLVYGSLVFSVFAVHRRQCDIPCFRSSTQLLR